MGSARAAVITATNTNNDGPGSLRVAIQQANATVGEDQLVSASLLPSLATTTSTDCDFDVPTEPGDHPFCVTRDARFWFTQAFNDDESCATLLKALQANGGGLNLGFACLPTTFRNADAFLDEYDALIEALGFYYRSQRRTGEENGAQTLRLRGSKLCRERKRLAIEMTAAGSDLNAIVAYTVLLRKFNSSGVTTDFVGGLLECEPVAKRKELKQISRDPTLQFDCPGINDFCDSAEEALSFPFNLGIVLSSGDVANVLPPNDSSSAGTNNNLPGDPDLDNLIPGFDTFDAAILEFDFIPAGDTVTFTYVFASEEYHEFVDSSFNDVFGFFVNGVNYALIPDTVTPVSINNVNNGFADAGEPSAGPCNNCEFFVDNVGPQATRETQMDGLTTVLTFTAPVLAGQTNSFKIGIADAGDSILDSAVFIEAGSFKSGGGDVCVTRDSRFWFTHVFRNDNPSCVSLESAMPIAIYAGCDGLNIGFMEIPTGFRNDDNDRDGIDATIEALGFYYRNQGRTGELTGLQERKLKASALCRERKRLTIEFISAIANTAYLGSDPALCFHVDGGEVVPFSATLLADTRDILGGFDINAIRNQTVLLRKFNSSGVLNDLPPTLVQCAPGKKKDLKRISRDPSTQFSCPGVNSSCARAEPVVFSSKTGQLGEARFRGKANMLKLNSTRAFWIIHPGVAVANRRFTVDTFGSNYDTLLTVFRGKCQVSLVNGLEVEDRSQLELVTFNDDADLTPQSKLSFTADGSSYYLIQVEGGTGQLKLSVTSP